MGTPPCCSWSGGCISSSACSVILIAIPSGLRPLSGRHRRFLIPCRTPVHLVAAADHPLVGRSGLTDQDLDPFPSLALPSGLFPKTEAVLRSHGLWQNRVRMKRFRPELWQGRTEDQVTLTYASSLALQAMPGLVRLDYDLGLVSGEALVMRRDLQEQLPLQELKTCLVHRCEGLAGQFADLQMVGEA